MKIREISKHLNWELFRKPPIKLETVSILQSCFGINAEMEKLSGDMHVITEHLV
jgi:hypothetical protein